MSNAKLHIYPPHLCLISQLIDELGSLTVSQLEKSLVLLPTQRLITYVIARLAKNKGAYFPPKMMTMEQLIHNGAVTSADSLKPVSNSAFDFLLAQKLQASNFQHLRSGHERELRLILGELYDNELRDKAFEQLAQKISEDIYKDDNHLGSLFLRSREIEKILSTVEKELALRGLAIKQKLTAEKAQKIAAHWQQEDCSSVNFDRIYVAGFTSLAPSWRPLLHRLANDKRVEFYFSEPPDTYQKSSPVGDLIDDLSQKCGLLAANSINSPKDKASLVEVCETSSPYREVEFCLELIHQSIENGITPSSIAILVSNEGHYHDYLSSLLEQSDLKYNIALTKKMAQTSLGRWVTVTRNLCLEKVSLTSLIGWLSHPMSEFWINSQIENPNEKISISQVITSLSRFKIIHSWQQLQTLCTGSSLEKLIKIIEIVRNQFHKKQKHPLSEWLNLFEKIIEKINYEDLSESEYLEAIKESLSHFSDQFENLDSHFHTMLSANDFWQFIDDHFQTLELRTIGEPLSGIQVLSLAEARYFPFELVFILGCNEGTFPKSLPSDELLDNYLKKQMGLPGWEVLEAMEDQTFHLLKERLPKLYLIRCKNRLGEMQVRSRFIEKLVTESSAKIHTIADRVFFDAQLTQSLQSGYVEICDEGLFFDDLSSLWTLISASSLENLMRCPYKFLLSQIGVRDHKPLHFEKDLRQEGEWLHAVLEAFFTGSHKGKIFRSPLNIDELNDDKQAIKRLDELTIALAPDTIIEQPLYKHLKFYSWPAFVGHIQRFYSKLEDPGQSLKHGLREAKIGQSITNTKHSWESTVSLRGLTRQCSGSIDSIDYSSSLILITDYKRSRIPDRKDILSAVSPQLTFYALVLSQNKGFPISSMILGYWNIMNATWHLHSMGKSAKHQAIELKLASSRSHTTEDIVEQTTNLWVQREKNIMSKKKFWAEPKACGLCDYANICRKNDPIFEAALLKRDS